MGLLDPSLPLLERDRAGQVGHGLEREDRGGKILSLLFVLGFENTRYGNGSRDRRR